MFQLCSSLVLHLVKMYAYSHVAQNHVTFSFSSNITMLSFHFAKYQFIWFTVLTKDFNKNVPNIYQIFHIYQIKNLYTKHVKNISNLKNLVCTVYTSWQHCSLDQRTCGLCFLWLRTWSCFWCHINAYST